MAFNQKKLRVSFDLASGNFGSSGGNKLTLDGLRIAAKIIKAGSTAVGSADVAVYGMALSQMNQLPTFGNDVTTIGKNRITIEAAEGDGQYTTVFQGTAKTAWMDGANQPQVPFRVIAFADGGSYEAVKPAKPTSVKGSGDVAQMMEGLAKTMGLTFQNSGVKAKLSNHYSWGSSLTQVQQIARAAGIEFTVDNGTLAIWPTSGHRPGGRKDVISKDTILVSYPAFNSMGIILRTLFDPNLEYGTVITVKSDITGANGQWRIYRLELDLSSQLPHGPWFTTINAGPLGSTPVA